MSTEEYKVVECVVAPDGVLTNGKTALILYPADDIRDETRIAYARGAHNRRFHVGHVYAIEMSSEKARLSQASWVGQHKDRELAQKWQALQKAKEVADAAARTEKREATNTSGLDEPIGQLREVYHQLAYNQRLGFELWLLQQVRKLVPGAK